MFQNLRRFINQLILEFGFKIIWYYSTFFLPEDYFGKSFETRGISSNKIKNYFETVPSHIQDNVTSHGFYLVQKFALLVGTNLANMMIRGIEQYLANKTVSEKQGWVDPYSCYAIPDIMDNLPFFLDLHLVNRDWILETLESLRENGLENKWDAWSNWAYRFYMKYDMEDIGSYKKKSNDIGLHNLYAVFLFWVGLSAIAGLIFLCEYTFGQTTIKLQLPCIQNLVSKWLK